VDISEIGQTYQFLLRQRIAESKPSGRRRMRPGESDVVSILRSADVDGIDQFNDFLRPQGMQIREYTDTDFGAIPVGGKIWLLARHPEGNPPEYMSTKRIYEAIRLRDNESHESGNIWFLHIWLIYLSLIYTRPGRGVSQISDYKDAMFLEKQLIDAVREHIEKVRNIGIDKGATRKVVEVLDSEKGSDVSRRIKGFLSLMCDSGLLIQISDGEYQQTLLGAVEIAEGFDRSMRHYIIPEESVLNNIVNVMAPETEQTDEMEVADVIN